VVVVNGRPTTTDVLLAPLNPRPPAPLLVSPGDDSIFSEIPAFTWRTAPYALRYRIEIATDSLFSNLVFFDSTLTDTTLAPTFASDDTSFYWRVRGGNTYGWGPFSVSRSFILNQSGFPPTPVMLFPADDSTISQTYPTFVWRQAPNTQNYLLEISYDSLFAGLILSDSNLIDTTLDWTEPPVDTLYYWRIKGGNNDGWGTYSEVRSFTLSAYTGIADGNSLPLEFGLMQNYPNPFNLETSISFRIPAGGEAQLAIYDLGGRQVRLYTLVGQAGEAWQKITWDGRDARGSEVNSGVYFYRLSSRSSSLGRMMILLK
jgi:hypothetical protein